MDEKPRRADRWLPLLGVALIFEAVAVAGIRQSPRADIGAITAILGAALGVVTLLRHFRPLPPSSWVTAGFAVFIYGAMTLVESFVTLDLNRGGDPLRHLEFPARTLTVGGAVLFWAAALARRDHSSDERLARLGRIGAGLAQVGFLFSFVREISVWGNLRWYSNDNASFAVYSVVRLIYRVLLLWASIQMMRSGTDPEVLQKRFTGVHHLLIAWITLALVSGVVATFGFGDRTMAMPYFWRHLLSTTATVTVAFTLASRFRTLPTEKAVAA
jgi:hypothetical protein